MDTIRKMMLMRGGGGASALQLLLDKFTVTGDEVAYQIKIASADYTFILLQHLVDRYYAGTRLSASNNAVGQNVMRIEYNKIYELFHGYNDKTATAVTMTNWTASSNAGIYSGQYMRTTTAGSTLAFTTPAWTTKVGAVVYTGLTNAGMVLVTIDGDNTLADLLPTAQDLVTGGTLASSALVANGGTLNPTDRIMDCYNLSNTNFEISSTGKIIPFTRSLSAGAHTVLLTQTAYKNVNATENLFTGILLILAGGSGSGGVTSATWPVFNPYQIATSQFPTHEVSYSFKPTGASGYEWLGHTNSLKTRTVPAMTLDGATITQTHMAFGAGSKLVVTIAGVVRHSETGATDLGNFDLTYTVDKATGLTIAHTTDWSSGGVAKMYPCMMAVNHAYFDRYNTLGSGAADSDLTDNDDAVNFNTDQAAGYAWDADGNMGAIFSIPNLATTVENWSKSGTNKLWWSDVSANSGTWKKIYATRFGSDEIYTSDIIWTSEANYRFVWFADGADSVLAGLEA